MAILVVISSDNITRLELVMLASEIESRLLEYLFYKLSHSYLDEIILESNNKSRLCDINDYDFNLKP